MWIYSKLVEYGPKSESVRREGGGELITPKPNMPFMEGLGISSVSLSLFGFIPLKVFQVYRVSEINLKDDC